jgi:sugar lactone lactonase YvrE
MRYLGIILVAGLAVACGSSPAATATLAPSATVSQTASPTAFPSATSVATLAPTAIASPSPGPTAAPTPTAEPTLGPTVAPATIAPSTNIVEVVAGGGTADPAAGGVATDAHLTRVTGLAVAADGTIWIVDSNAGTLLTVNPDGLIHTVATGMYGPQGMCLAPDGRAYVAERGAYRIVTTNDTGGVKPIAGNEYRPGFKGDGGLAKKALLSQPYDVVADAAGNLYIADTANARVRFISAETGKISTIAGNGIHDFAGDGGQAIDASLTNPQAVAVDPLGTVLYIADYGDSHLRRVDLVTGIITTVAGSGAGSVAYDPTLTALQVAPTRLIAVALDAEGNVYLPVFFTDRGQMVMRMDPTGHLTVVAGGGTLSEPGVAATAFLVPTIEVLEIEPATGALLIGSNNGIVYRIPGVATPVV